MAKKGPVCASSRGVFGAIDPPLSSSYPLTAAAPPVPFFPLNFFPDLPTLSTSITCPPTSSASTPAVEVDSRCTRSVEPPSCPILSPLPHSSPSLLLSFAWSGVYARPAWRVPLLVITPLPSSISAMPSTSLTLRSLIASLRSQAIKNLTSAPILCPPYEVIRMGVSFAFASKKCTIEAAYVYRISIFSSLSACVSEADAGSNTFRCMSAMTVLMAPFPYTDIDPVTICPSDTSSPSTIPPSFDLKYDLGRALHSCLDKEKESSRRASNITPSTTFNSNSSSSR
mmetsp:Transcript_30565/g.79705  ORF Transcript_30565/g.79705 Transcript_30565/m.79705 type:complete len:284 (-) Transcript_30565:2224-3075(-)